MAIQGKFDTVTLVAGQDLTVAGAQYKAVGINGTIAATQAAAFGLLQNKPASGDHATVAYKGHLKAYAGAAINSGSLLTVTTSGFITSFTAGASSAGLLPVGKSLTQAASGDLFDGLFDFV